MEMTGVYSRGIQKIFSRAEENGIVREVFAELGRARELHPVWPTSLVDATFIMIEESGEVVQAVNNLVWSHKNGTVADVRKEVIETMAMCIRLLTETPGL